MGVVTGCGRHRSTDAALPVQVKHFDRTRFLQKFPRQECDARRAYCQVARANVLGQLVQATELLCPEAAARQHSS